MENCPRSLLHPINPTAAPGAPLDMGYGSSHPYSAPAHWELEGRRNHSLLSQRSTSISHPFELLPGSGPGKGGGMLLLALPCFEPSAQPQSMHPEASGAPALVSLYPCRSWSPLSHLTPASSCSSLSPPLFRCLSSTIPSSPPNLSCFSFEPSPSSLWIPPTLFPLPSCYTEQHVTTGWVPAPAAWPCSLRVCIPTPRPQPTRNFGKSQGASPPKFPFGFGAGERSSSQRDATAQGWLALSALRIPPAPQYPKV